MSRKRTTYPKEYKIEVVRQAATRGGAQVGEELGIHPVMISRWKRELELGGEEAFVGSGHARDKELSSLLKEVKRLREENEILKKAYGVLRKSPRQGTGS